MTTERSKRQGRYVLGDLLGRGGMAEVFAGFVLGSHGFQKPVAIKRLLPALANDHVFVERLIGEAKLLVGMQHGNVVSVLDLARDGDDVFLVMEFVDGPSLRGLLKARGARGLSLGAATYIVQSAAAGLQFAHARPGGAVIHADISPSNLLLTTSGEVRVADFGIARREGLGEGIVEGKWAYMAPEQVRGDALTPAADVFALGIVLYELVCGQHPLGRRITSGERATQPLKVVPPRIVRASVTPGLDAICMRALADEPRDRFATMQEMIDAISDERFAQGWREGAADLATAIREVQLGAGPAALLAHGGGEPGVTLVTRSLLASGTQPGTHPGTNPGTVHGAGPGTVHGTGPAPMFEASVAQPVAPVAAPVARWKLGAAVLGAATLVGVLAAALLTGGSDPIAPVATLKAPIPLPLPAATPAATATATISPAPPQSLPLPQLSPPPSSPSPSPSPPPLSAPALGLSPSPPGHSRVVVPAASAAKKATLRVTSDPWAYVTVDDGQKAETPSARFALAAGHHTVHIKNGVTGATVTRQVTLAAGETSLVRVRSEDWP